MTSYFDRLVFTILIAWFLQSLQRLCCFSGKYIRTTASFVRVCSFRRCCSPLPDYIRHQSNSIPQLTRIHLGTDASLTV
ncbi:hypothetical protein VB735_08405 [Halotia wernerae UHCC 0503]|nr:hypothetical protein [Halotia wernerae UHCC 0503]